MFGVLYHFWEVDVDIAFQQQISSLLPDVEQLKVIQRGIMTLNTLHEVRRFIESLKSV